MKNVFYHFENKWEIDHPIGAVWDALTSYTDWPRWWKGMKEVELVKEINPSEQILRYTTGSVIYFLHYTVDAKIDKAAGKMHAETTGDLKGMMDVTITKITENKTLITYNWDVVTTKTWMNVSAPLLKPFFERSHELVMAWGRQGLQKYLDT